MQGIMGSNPMSNAFPMSMERVGEWETMQQWTL